MLAELPHIARVVLREERDLGLDQLARAEIPVPDDDRAHAVDHLRQVRDRGDEAMSDALGSLDRPPLVDELHAGLQRCPGVVDGRRVREAGRVVAIGGGCRARTGQRDHQRGGDDQPHPARISYALAWTSLPRRLVDCPCESQVQHGHHEQVQQGRRDQAADDDDGQRVLDLVARRCCRRSRAARAPARSRASSSRSARAAPARRAGRAAGRTSRPRSARGAGNG